MIYKFYSFNENNITAFENYSVWFSKPKNFNDPFEGIYIDNTHEMSNDEFIKFCKENRKGGNFVNIFNPPENFDEWLMEIYVSGKALEYKKEFQRRGTIALEMHQKSFYESGVCCFIMDKDTNPIANTLMWGHYGDGLKGYALGISKEPHEIFYGNDIANFPVKYEPEPPKLNATEMMKSLIGKESRNITLKDIEIAIKIVNTKHDVWDYEKELRFISLKRGNQLVKYNENSIDSIYIGEKMPSWQKTTLIHIAKKNGIINFFEAKVNKKAYSVSLERITVD
ncbi:DUF2971 domain-containing protein [Aeromonas hydrophila]|uniref:DUF2971 domain-containing protein n=1 Tax=Aeromonas hydrophila TaxID=644 RepID=UPI0038CFFBC9